MPQIQSNAQYFDLHIEGEGFLSRARFVKVKKGQPFLAVTVSAYHGTPGEYSFVPFDVKVVGAEAKKLIQEQLMNAANDPDRKVKIGFRIADPYIDTYSIERGERACQVQACVKGRLLKITWAEVNGQRVYLDPKFLAQYEARDKMEPIILSIRGLGYLNRMFKGKSGIVGALGAFHGTSDDVTYLNLDVRVEDAVTSRIVESKLIAPVTSKEDKVLIGFNAINLKLKSFLMKNGENVGQTGFVLDASIVNILYAKVNGQVVHQVIQASAGSGDVKTGTDDAQS